jgi:hypothetical protein
VIRVAIRPSQGKQNEPDTEDPRFNRELKIAHNFQCQKKKRSFR